MISRFRHMSRLLAGGSSLALAAAVAPGLAFAQEEDAPAAQRSDDVVLVTGSRIARDPNLASPVPVQSLDSEALQLSGEISLADVVNRIPALLASTTSEQTLTGANALNLRGLGSVRTLTLVNGRRHVAGFEGEQSVDIGSIPRALVERVEVLTGGASAIYGSDAVTGVVNFILRDDFEGQNYDVRFGISSRGDAENASFQGLWGKNFHEGRGNVTFALDYTFDSVLRFGDRPWAANNGLSRSLPNPALRFQHGDITSATPLFGNFFNFQQTGRYPIGLAIPGSAQAFIDQYNATFGTNLTVADLSPAELALIERRNNSPSRAILPQPNFSISSRRGVISPGNFGLAPGIDTNGSGIDDCLESFVGWNNSLAGTGSFGFAGGCWVVNDNGSVRPYRDGLVAGNFNQFGGDGIEDVFDLTYLIPQTERITANLNARYDLTQNTRAFFEFKASQSVTERGTPLNTFYDLLYGAPDNPFLPQELQGLAQQTGGLFITRDPTDLGPNINQFTRDTYRVVAGLQGEFDNGWSWEVAANFGQFTNTTKGRNTVLLDRFFAAIDVVSDANGNPVCRSDLDPAAVPPTTIFGIPDFDPGFYTFTPGDGQCRPANIWGGPNSISADAVDFITTTTVDELRLEQTVLSGFLTGDFGNWFTLPAGPVSFATGIEYRRESSRLNRDNVDLGILPAGSPFGEGTLISDVSANGSLGFNALSQFFNSSGKFDVTDVFVELSVPVLAGLPLAEELTIDGAYRYADYSTVGGAETWKLGFIWTPVDDISFRGTYSQAIRAPNIDELFRPDNPAFFRPIDPCDASELANAPDPALRAANCQAGGSGLPGLPVGFTDPLSARFPGVAGGNANLQEEKADTVTLGLVFTPRILPGFNFTLDYWNVEIEDGIGFVTAQQIVDGCYDSTDFPNSAFCGLFDRETDSSSPQFGGFRFLRQSFVNFASIKARGYDFSASYSFDWREYDFRLGLSGTRQERLDFFNNPLDATDVTNRLEELRRPVWAGNASFGVTRDSLSLGWNTQYVGRQALGGVEVDTIEALFGDAGWAPEMFIHNFNAAFRLNDTVRFYGGVNNVFDESPYVTERAWPAGPRGRFFFFGVEASF
ncbi:TonB-dependent receptor domain-containing protein [Alkalicaulis satelles]|nr:TonB-dependent receptor [Alkalicaulis satelles]